jgi:hypothetical protein
MEFGLIDGVLETEYWIHDSLPNHLMPTWHHTAICYQTDRPVLPSMIICPWYMSRVLVPEIDHMYKTDRAKYEATAHSWIQKYAMGWSLLRRQIWILRYKGICVIMPLFSLPVAACLFWGCWEKIEVGLAFCHFGQNNSLLSICITEGGNSLCTLVWSCYLWQSINIH